MKLIPLTQGQFAKVDDDDFERISAYKWYALRIPNTNRFYAVRMMRCRNGSRKIVRMHRVIMKARRFHQVDHRFHDTLDNRKSRLRLCSVCDNQRNKHRSSHNKSGFKGVSRVTNGNMWYARIGLNRKSLYIGAFSTPELAAAAYDREALRLYGEFAFLNFPL